MDDNEIDVEDLMRKIKDEMERSKKGEDNISKPSDQIKESLDWINSNWDIQKDSYHICSHRPLIGKALIHGRKLIHGEVRRYVDPLQEGKIISIEILPRSSGSLPEGLRISRCPCSRFKKACSLKSTTRYPCISPGSPPILNRR